MWIRAAYWTGTVKPGQEVAFRDGIDNDMIPGLKAMATVRDAQALWPQRREDGAPSLACQIMVAFESREQIDQMLASPERQELRKRAVGLAAMFDGNLSHIDFEMS